MSFPLPVVLSSWDEVSDCDALILVSNQPHCQGNAAINSDIEAAQNVDHRIGRETVLIYSNSAPGKRLVLAPTGNLLKDVDDVRNFGDAAKQGLAMAVEAGATKPLIVVEGLPSHSNFQNALAVSYLSACQGLWKPLEAREVMGEEKLEPVTHIFLLDADGKTNAEFLTALESGRRLARDLCGTEPERMAPPKFADYCEQAFAGSSVQVSVESDRKTLETEYPLLAAVARASQSVERHQPRVIHLTYQGEGPIERTLMLVGKAVTYDTGGADLKVGGHMAGMSRDKGGAAAVAGFMKAIAELKPKGLKVIAKIGAVRNSIGADCFVADEIITAHSGKRVRIGNTDAEGRLVMCDLLSHCRAQATSEVNPSLFTIATLTGHAALTAGPYTIYVENGPARQQGLAQQLQASGEAWGDCGEISRPRREDWKIIRPRSEADDVLSSNNGPSVSIARGHQFPMAFLSLASGLDEHGQFAEKPVPYCHIDIAGSGVESGDWQHDKPTAAPVVALASSFLL
ncbi:M17 family metallopeptidase [Pleionea litopenaei]|uniref:Leucyl aminopeptidase family protein n=1 Tax=Pleionea litopenaei TaxID=3070815 RepID=A0AA51RT38_9GAMM|nr:leucyl aminopeptidase family protein [Pleionea sp. HL-JVS1]WMS86974.1 leucyl aminopeptidase family protein [Pleionea sp. HL-JVS1]